MANATPTQSERHEFIDGVLDVAWETIHDPEVAKYLGNGLVTFSRMIELAEVVSIVDGEIQAPTSDNPDVLPVISMQSGEVLVTSNYYDTQTPSQRKKTTKAFKEWGPAEAETEDLVESVNVSPGVEYRRVEVVMDQGVTAAMTGMNATIYSESNLRASFLRPPTKGFAFIKKRPFLILRHTPDDVGFGGDMVLHELTHFDQGIRDPISVIHSQRSADMAMLRLELEAYHVGSMASRTRFMGMARERAISFGDLDLGLKQVLVELVRQRNGVDPTDPYKPSGGLLRKLGEAGLGNVLHNNISYDEILEMLAANDDARTRLRR